MDCEIEDSGRNRKVPRLTPGLVVLQQRFPICRFAFSNLPLAILPTGIRSATVRLSY